MQTELTQRTTAQIGEAIPHELGAQMINDYQVSNPTDVKSYSVGREIIEKIMAQPDCAGIKFYNAYNEAGQKTLVYVGLDQFGKSLVEFATVNKEGNLDNRKAIVADRAGTSTSNDTEEWFTELFF